MNAKHTPGPWWIAPKKSPYIATSDNPTVLSWLQSSGRDKFYALSVGTALGSVAIIPLDESNEANARLVAAAPELLEALRVAEKALIDSFECFKSEHGPILNQKTFGYLETLDEVIKYSPGHVKELIIVRAAIAKATGQ